MFKMEFKNDKVFETKECKDFVKRVVNYDSSIIKTSSFLKENSTLCFRKVLLFGFLMHKKIPEVSFRGNEHV